MASGTSRYARGSNQYVKRPKQSIANPPSALRLAGELPDSVASDTSVQAGITFNTDGVDLSHLKKRTVEEALRRLQHSLPDHVWNAASLEGNTCTIVEVRTLLDNTTIGGHKLQEEQQVTALIESYRLLESFVRDRADFLHPHTACCLHQVVAAHESLDAGMFRGSGSTHGGGHVRLSNGQRVEGVSEEELPHRWSELARHARQIDDPRLRAFFVSAVMTRNQFFFDGNKRTSRLVASGILLSHGYDGLSIPFSAREEYNHALDTLFLTGDSSPLVHLYSTVHLS